MKILSELYDTVLNHVFLLELHDVGAKYHFLEGSDSDRWEIREIIYFFPCFLLINADLKSLTKSKGNFGS